VRILMIAPPWFTVPPAAYGGTEQVVALLVRGLVAGGHEVTLVASGGSRTPARLLSPFAVPPTASLGVTTIELAHVGAAYQQRDAFDVVHDHTVPGLAAASVPGGPPVVHTAHGAWLKDAEALYRGLAGHVHVVTISHDQARRAPRGVRVAATVHNAVDVDAHAVTARKGDHLAFVGRANPQKGPDVAIEVARRTGRPLRMAIKVNEADEREYFATVIRPSLDRADVELVEVATQADKLELLGSAAAVLFPIRWDEPFGLVPIEANAAGTPVVAFSRGAVPEVLEDGRGGVLVAPDDLEGFVAAVEVAAAMDPAGCRASVKARFDAPRMVNGYLAVYERVLTRSGREVATVPVCSAPAPRVIDVRESTGRSATLTAGPQRSPTPRPR
jgi:glycosyltransferase involved in cell wall biosynthesis